MSTEPIVTEIQAPPPPPKRSTFRVNYYVNGQVKTAFVVAYTLDEAAEFLGVRDGSASGASVAYPVEVPGLDEAHAPLPQLPVTKTDPTAQGVYLSASEYAKFKKLIGE